MTLRMAEQIDECGATTVRRVVRVKLAAEILDLSATCIYKLIDCGELEAHYAGRGHHFLRVYLDSIANFQSRKHVTPNKIINKNNKKTDSIARRPRGSAQHRESLAFLTKQGILDACDVSRLAS